MTFFLYAFFVLMQFILKNHKKDYRDLLQIPFSIVFSLFLDFFDNIYDWFTTIIDRHPDVLWEKSILLIIAVFLTGAGVSMMISMDLIPNPADGLAYTIGQTFNKNLGFGKNFIDITTVIITLVIGLIIKGRPIGVGPGTIIAMIGVGRCIALFNHCFLSKMLNVSGRAQ